MKYMYKPKGVCSSMISFDIDNDIVTNIKFTGGCNGNSKGLAKLADGMSRREIIEKCKGIKCGIRDTSCPDQLVKGIEESLKEV